MVNILLVSHSEELARGLKKLAQQMVGDAVIIKAVGGSKDGSLGTDVDAVYQALNELNREDEVLIFLDMGSAVMNAELAFEFFSEAEQEKLFIVNQPMVEGAVVAAIEASAGKSAEEIIAFLKSEDLSKKIG